jgi:hypothetical protein
MFAEGTLDTRWFRTDPGDRRTFISRRFRGSLQLIAFEVVFFLSSQDDNTIQFSQPSI